MAAIVWTPTVTDSKISADLRTLTVYGTLAGSGTYTSLGDTLSFAVAGIPSGSVPLVVWVQPAAAGTTIRQYFFIPGTTIANGKLQVFASGGAEYSGAAPTEAIMFEAVFPRI